MDELDYILKRHKTRLNKEMNFIEPHEQKNTISKVFSKILISIILILISCIYINLDKHNLASFKKYVFEDNITFAKINTWYHQNFGNILPTITNTTDQTVFENTLGTLVKEEYLDGYKIKASAQTPINALASGILVYADYKEGYGNTLIIQGVDGVDVWYGNITDLNVKLYDYIEKGTILGSNAGDEYYLVFLKEGNKVTYDEYINKVES